jgi:hypothetical protein
LGITGLSIAVFVAAFVPHFVKKYGKAVIQRRMGVVDQIHARVILRPEKEPQYP